MNPATLPGDGEGFLLEDGPTFHRLSAERDLLRAPSAGGKGLLALGDPDYGEAPPGTIAAAGARLRRAAGEACRLDLPSGFAPLPESRLEVQGVGRGWQPASEVESLVGALASEANLKGLAKGRRVLHVAAHGFFAGRSCEGPAPPAGAEALLRSGLFYWGAFVAVEGATGGGAP